MAPKGKKGKKGKEAAGAVDDPEMLAKIEKQKMNVEVRAVMFQYGLISLVWVHRCRI